MKIISVRIVFLLVVFWLPSTQADPQLSSWFTELSGRYASLYPDKDATESVITWSHGQGNQLAPAYAGVADIRYDVNWVYIRTSGLPFHKMGPWYLDANQNNLFVNFPAHLNAEAGTMRFPRNPIPATNLTRTNGGTIGFFVDGVSMYDFRDAMSYSTIYGVDYTGNFTDPDPNDAFNSGDGVWNRDAYHNESVTFDPAYAHQGGSSHHYHATPIALRYLLGDNIEIDAANPRLYNELAVPPAKHSPILGWARDGYPVYGPYGYNDPDDPSSAIVRMISGYQKRSDLAIGTQRTSIPQWSIDMGDRTAQIAADRYGPIVGDPANGDNFVLGHYAEDFEYRGHNGQMQITASDQSGTFHLDMHNGRQCVTPEFPNGTYAYFIATAVEGGEVVPFFPYIIGRSFYGEPTGGTVAQTANFDSMPVVGGGVEQYFAGPANTEGNLDTIAVDSASGDVTLTWDATAGGNYRVETTSDMVSWETLPLLIKAESETASIIDAGVADDEDKKFYRLDLESLDTYDDQAVDLGQVSSSNFTVITISLSGTSNPPAELNDLPDSITFDGSPVALLSRPSQNEVRIAAPANLAGGNYTVTATWDGSSFSATHTQVDKDNILLLILDDWGHDHSPWDNTGGTAARDFAQLTNLRAIANSGLKFTNAYANPMCSPTRATILTGRQAFRTSVGSPPGGDFNIDGAEQPLGALFRNSSVYEAASFGKWHLGGGDEGYDLRGGWEFFAGSNDNPGDYFAWEKNRNGVTSNSQTYSTTDQVNEAKAFIDSQNLVGKPWFVWMGFNAPHETFHNPPTELRDPTYSYPSGPNNQDKRMYLRMLDALDMEIGRLLESVDQNRTNIIIIGDNGSPGSVVQYPYGDTDSPTTNSHAKGDLYEGGIHVPLVVKGPAVSVSGTNDSLVNSADLYSTILDLAGIPVPSGGGDDSVSLVPLLTGGTGSGRYAHSEAFIENGLSEGDGRSIRLDAHRDYKLIIWGNPVYRYDVPSYSFFHLASDINETNDLVDGATDLTAARTDLSGNPDALAAFNACVDKDLALGGGFSDPSIGTPQTLFIRIPTSQPGQGQPPAVGTAPDSVIIDGFVADYVARNDPDPNGTDDRYWLEVVIPQGNTYTAATVNFPDNPSTGAARDFDVVEFFVP